jgi:hypothetical protein
MEKKDYSGGPWARPVRTVFFSMLWLVVLCGIWAALTAPPPKPRTVEDEQRNAIAEKARQAAEKDRQQLDQGKRELCRAGGPALPQLVGTPNIVECFFLTNFQ